MKEESRVFGGMAKSFEGLQVSFLKSKVYKQKIFKSVLELFVVFYTDCFF